MNKYLSDPEVKALIERTKSGDNKAWEELYENYKKYIHECCWKRLRKLEMTDSLKNEIEEDLYMAGWQGFIHATKNHDSEKGKFTTYATYYIDGEISKELDVLLNPLGLTGRSKTGKKTGIIRASLEEIPETKVARQKTEDRFQVRDDAPDRGKYSAERRTLQILDILKTLTDESKSLSKDELMNLLKKYRIAKYDNGVPVESPNTITSTLEDILLELDPLEYSENEEKYRVKYDGYKEDRLNKKINKDYCGKAPDITGFSYVHTFTDSQLDQLIGQVCFSSMLSSAEKAELISKLVGTASAYYRTPFWDGEKIRFDPKAIHSRLSGQRAEKREQLAENLKIIQYAVNNFGQIRFRYNRYTDDKKMIPTSEYIRTLSPYHLVVYHDDFFCIGLKTYEKGIWHYRVDLMSDLEIAKDENGKIIPIEVCSFEGLPIFNACWDPEKYMSEHMNMAYDEPEDIRIMIKNTDYTIIHDWFGDHYEKVKEVVGKDEKGNEVGYDIVKVRTSPNMIVHWAMQYGVRVEIMDENIRKKIREEIKKVGDLYL